MRILIIEDEEKTINYMRKGLAEHGYIVDASQDGQEGYQLAIDRQYDLIILDVMLPTRDGWSVIQGIRAANKQTPVLFLSARDGLDDRVKGLELGADDYLVKPFAFSELLARIRSILRRGQVQQSEMLEILDLKIDCIKHKVKRQDKNIDLTPKEFALLSLLVKRQGELLSRTLIAEQVWDMNFDSDTNVVDVAIRRLRKKVDDPFEQRLIHTVRGVGYVLEGS